MAILTALGTLLALTPAARADTFRWRQTASRYSKLECAKFPSTDDSIHFEFRGGQSLQFGVTNTNVLGLPVTVNWNHWNEDASTIIAPGQTRWVWMNVFGNEPIGNDWDLTTPADSRSYVWMIRSNRCDHLRFH